MSRTLKSDATGVFDTRDPVVVRGLSPDEHVRLRRTAIRQAIDT